MPLPKQFFVALHPKYHKDDDLKILVDNKVKIEQADVMSFCKKVAKAQFAQYGMPSAPEEMIENFSKQILENKEQAQKIYEKLYELKVVEYVKSQIKVSNKSVSAEDFAKLAQEM